VAVSDRIEDDMIKNSMDTPIVPPPPASAPSARSWGVYVALPVITISWMILVAIVLTASIRIDRYELAPGDAIAVAPRINFAALDGSDEVPERFRTDGGIHFVTALGGQLSILDAILGWIDPHVQVDTYEQRFGNRTPEENRQIGFQSMVTSKQIAQFVALKKLGMNAELVEGRARVAAVVCDGAPEENSACENLKEGDTIVAVNGVEIPTLAALLAEMSQSTYVVGQTVTVSVVPRDASSSSFDRSKAQDRKIQLMGSDDGSRPIIGIVPADTRTVQLPFDVQISTTDIGGPSAGLAFTLSLLDELTSGNLMGNGRVAATGTIRQDGSVGAIGALVQKAVAVRESGVTLFLVPSEQSDTEIAQAQKAAGRSVKIVAVSNLDEALDALRQNGGDPLPRSS
jgi:PDZ domain-containing protein